VLAGVLLIALASVSWGTTGSVSTLLATRAGVEPLLVGAARMAVAAPLLLAGSRLLAGTVAVAPGDGARALLMGACMAGYQAAYFTAVALTGIAVTAVVAICSAPLMIAALAALLLGERLTARVVAALALGVAGTSLLVAAPEAGARGAGFAAGVGLALLAGLAYALYAVIAKAGVARSGPLPLTALAFTAAAVLMAPALLAVHEPESQVARGWPWLLYLGAVATAGAYALYAAGLRRVPASAAGVVTLLEPLTAAVLGAVVFGERVGPAGVVGAALLVAAIVVLLPRRGGGG